MVRVIQFFILILISAVDIHAQSRLNVNLYLSATPGVGICAYNKTKGFGIGLSILQKPIQTSRIIEVASNQYRRYSPAYTEVKLDIFTGKTRANSRIKKYRLNPFIYGYFGNGKTDFTSWQGGSAHTQTSTVKYSKVSAGLGLNIFRCFRPANEGPLASYLFFGFSAGYKEVSSEQNINPDFNDGALNHIALRVNLGVLVSLHN